MQLTRETVIAAAKRLAAGNQGVLNVALWREHSSISEKTVRRLVPGGFRALCRLIHPGGRSQFARYSDDQLLREYHRVALRLRHWPSWTEFDRHGQFTSQSLRTRFGGRTGLNRRYAAWLAKHPRAGRAPIPSPPRRGQRTHAAPRPLTLGDPLDFRCLRYAPSNEAGVVFLFGHLAPELGFLVEGFNTGYPDCAAIRLIDRSPPRWHRCLIEFEFHSSNFLIHGHDPAGCDLIVCWEHDWPDCPLQVIELRREVARLAAARPRPGPAPAPGNGRHPPGRPTGRPS